MSFYFQISSAPQKEEITATCIFFSKKCYAKTNSFSFYVMHVAGKWYGGIFSDIAYLPWSLVVRLSPSNLVFNLFNMVWSV
jgi:hypothetical protein